MKPSINKLSFVFYNHSYDVVSQRNSNIYARKFFGPDLPDLTELAQRTSLFLVNSHFSTNQARPTVPNFIEVAGLHITEPKPLPQVLVTIKQKQYKYLQYRCRILKT